MITKELRNEISYWFFYMTWLLTLLMQMFFIKDNILYLIDCIAMLCVFYVGLQIRKNE